MNNHRGPSRFAAATATKRDDLGLPPDAPVPYRYALQGNVYESGSDARLAMNRQAWLGGANSVYIDGTRSRKCVSNTDWVHFFFLDFISLY